MICTYLTDLAQSVDREIIYSVGSTCTKQPMQNYRFDQAEADIFIFSAYADLRGSGYSGAVVVDAADTNAYVVVAVIS